MYDPDQLQGGEEPDPSERDPVLTRIVVAVMVAFWFGLMWLVVQ